MEIIGESKLTEKCVKIKFNSICDLIKNSKMIFNLIDEAKKEKRPIAKDMEKQGFISQIILSYMWTCFASIIIVVTIGLVIYNLIGIHLPCFTVMLPCVLILSLFMPIRFIGDKLKFWPEICIERELIKGKGGDESG